MMDFLARGGPVMIPLLLCSVVALGLTLERIWSLRARRVLPPFITTALHQLENREQIDRLTQACDRHPSPLARMVHQSLLNRKKAREENTQILHNVGRRETMELERGLVTLEIIAGISPLLGLLGTVLGMVRVFDVISVLGMGQAGALSNGISEALVTTITGLAIAIPSLTAFNYLSKRVEDLVIELERQMTLVLNKLYSAS